MVKWAEVLKASKGLHARDSFSEIWGLKLKAAKEQWPITTLTGSLPLTYESRTEHILKNYVLYSSASGAGAETENLVNESEMLISKAISSITGIVAPSNYSNTTPLIKISPNTAYAIRLSGERITSDNSRGCCFFDENMEFISGFAYSGRTSSVYTRAITSVNNAEYVQLSVDKGVNTVMLTPGSTAPSTYVPYGYQIPLTNTGENSQSETYPLYIGSTKLGEEEYLDYESGKVYKRTANLYNKDAKNSANGFVNNGYLKTDGTIETSQDWTISEYINVLGNEYVYIINSNTNSDQVQSLCLYDENFERIHGIAYSGITGRYVTVISNARYVRISVRKSKENEAVLISGSTAPSSYIPYLQPTDPPAPFPAILTYQGENTLSSTETLGEVSITGEIKSN